MTQNWHDWVCLGLTTLAVGGTWLDSTALAQITPDDTLGAEGSRVRSNATVQGEPADLIEGGAVRNANLFHSFQEFNVEEQQRVYFDNPAGIDNIFSRVTGGNPSNILGTLGVDGAANLFLLNPNGILFGANASLDVQGSFLATTGNGFLFENNEVFSATSPEAPLLAVSVPLGVQYGANPPGAITVQGSALRVNEAQSLILAGGEVLLEDASLAVALLQNGQVVGLREGGRIDIGAVAGVGTLELSETNNLLSLRFPEDLARADVRLTDTTTLDVRANNGGDIAIAAQNIDILEGSSLLAGIFGGLEFPGSQAGDIRLDATNAIRIDQRSLLNNVVGSDTVGAGGTVEITTDTLQVSNGAQLSASTFGRGDAGNVIIDARDRVSFNNGSAFSSVESLEAVGTGGNVEITTGTLRVSNGAGLVTRTFGQGNAGNVIINARDRAVFDGGSAFTNVASSEAIGTGGNVEITTGSLRVSNRAALNAITFGQGNAGNIIINARNRVTFDGGSAVSNVGVGAVGTGGNVEITTGSLRVSSGAALSASTVARGDAGNIIINVRDRVSFDGGSARSVVESGAIGTGGRVEVTTGTLEVSNGAALNATTRGQGDAGDVVINARDRVSFDFGSAVSSVGSEAVGTGGTVEITTGTLQVNNETLLSASTRGQGDAGDIIINARDRVSFDGGSILSASTFGEGNAGDIIINARDRVSFDNLSDASTEVRSDAIGTGGDIVITTRALSVTNALGLFAGTSGQGDAGDIIINARDRVSFDFGLSLLE
ncbi:MAG: filamentous hemagglutinin N-terminal domain-containing protein [Leptolyngbyaceae cyanobacterium SM1_4_3]|nr:filamentous hemagglutinin N-terminal domain-containing protein [Leptolyngbyaceae cyanobacterium SM1_4_3]